MGNVRALPIGPQYISLRSWAEGYFAIKPPMYTLRRLARRGAIQPAPFLRGREFFVEPHAVFVGPVPAELSPKVQSRGQRTALYRHFDANDRLLYVGISLCAVTRLMSHAREAEWFDDIATVKIERFPTRAAALAAEAKAIVDEAPLHNVSGKPSWVIAPEIDDAAEMAKLERYIAARAPHKQTE